MKCQHLVDLRSPIRAERVRVPFKPTQTVPVDATAQYQLIYVLKCAGCKAEHRILVSDTSMPPGAIICNNELNQTEKL